MKNLLICIIDTKKGEHFKTYILTNIPSCAVSAFVYNNIFLVKILTKYRVRYLSWHENTIRGAQDQTGLFTNPILFKDL